MHFTATTCVIIVLRFMCTAHKTVLAFEKSSRTADQNICHNVNLCV